MRRITILFGLLCAFSFAGAQEYPRWFFEEGKLPQQHTAVGYANTSYFVDSAIAQAIRNGQMNYVRQQNCTIVGGQAFWNTEGGTFWMGSNFRETFDTSAILTVGKRLIKITQFISPSLVIVLLSDGDSSIDEHWNSRVSLRTARPPNWIQLLPQDSVYFYALGVAPTYYYEGSSWMEAEQMARRNLARNMSLKIQELQKMDASGQEIRNEECSVMLQQVDIIGRWRDNERGVYYVLARIQKN